MQLWKAKRGASGNSHLFLLLAVGCLTSWIWAANSDLTLFSTRYPGSKVATCSLCHSSTPALNSYGSDYRSAGRNASGLAGIESRDSDGDGFSNLQEIQAGTYPGNASDKPAQTTTTVVTTTTTTTASSSSTTTTLPSGSALMEFAHLAAGGGWRSFLIMNNNTSADVTGKVEFTASGGQPLVVEVDGAAKSSQTFTVKANGFLKLTLDSASAASPLTGWCRVTSSGSLGGVLVYQAKPGSVITTQASVLPSVRMRRFRVAMPQVGTNTELGMAVANVSTQSAKVTARYYTPGGQTLLPDLSIDIAPGTQYAGFVSQLVPGAPSGLEGVLEISSNADIVAVGLLAIYDYQLYTTVPIVALP